MAKYRLPGEYTYKGVNLLDKLMPLKKIRELENTEFSDGDIFVDSYPKSGAPFVHDIFREMTTAADKDTKSKEPARLAIPTVDFDLPGLATTCTAKTLAHPRYMDSHYPAAIYQKQLEAGSCKFVIVIRNPKDTLVSYYHFYQGWSATKDFGGTFNDFFELFKAKRLLYGDWLDHVLGWWQYRDRPNVLIVKYEDLKDDTMAGVKRIANFCGQHFTEKQLRKIVERVEAVELLDNLSVNMSVMPSVLSNKNNKPEIIIRRQGGDWRELFTPDMDAYMDDNYMRKAREAGLNF